MFVFLSLCVCWGGVFNKRLDFESKLLSTCKSGMKCMEPELPTLPKLQYSRSYEHTQYFLEYIRTKDWTWFPRAIPSSDDHSLINTSQFQHHFIHLRHKRIIWQIKYMEVEIGTCKHRMKKLHIRSKLLKICQNDRISTKLTFPTHRSLVAGLLSWIYPTSNRTM